jgi:IrrE N-terminal-like domain
MPRIGPRFLSYDAIWREVENFLGRYHSSKEIPVPIEEIVEFSLKINIIPIPNLLRTFEVDGFASSNLSEIYIDSYILERIPTRYRFTLAHEVGHIFLHRQIFEQVKIDSIDSWIEFYNGLDNFQRNGWELQGYNFAGLVLVPRGDLRSRVESILAQPTPFLRVAKSRRISRDKYLPYAMEELATQLAPIYDVSVQVVAKRLAFDKLETLVS